MVEYEVAIQSGCDFAIRRKTAKTSKLLVMLVSQNAFYIKDEKTDAVETLNVKNYTEFKMSMDKAITFENVNWTKTFYKRDSRDSLNNEYILRMVKNEDFQALAKKGLVCLISGSDSQYNLLNTTDLNAMIQNLNIYKYLFDNYGKKSWFLKTIKSLTSSFSPNTDCKPYCFADTMGYNYRVTVSRITWLDILAKISDDVFGLENTKMLIDLLISKDDFTITTLNLFYSIVRPENEMKFKYKDLHSYLDYAPIYNGFFRFDDFMRIYRDTLIVQYKLYEKIKEKYPKSLMLAHDIYNYQYHFKTLLINDKNFKKATEEAVDYEWGNKDYKVIAPKLPEDITDEAVQQCNCLRTYIEKISNGLCYIVFLRKKECIEQSYITIEINGNKVVQVEGANLRRTFTPKEYEILEAWAKDKKLKLAFGKYLD